MKKIEDFGWVPEQFEIDVTPDYLTVKYKGMSYGLYTTTRNVLRNELEKTINRLERRIAPGNRRQKSRGERRSKPRGDRRDYSR